MVFIQSDHRRNNFLVIHLFEVIRQLKPPDDQVNTGILTGDKHMHTQTLMHIRINTRADTCKFTYMRTLIRVRNTHMYTYVHVNAHV